MFYDVSLVRMEDIHCRQRLESLNKSNVDRISVLIANNNVKNQNRDECQEGPAIAGGAEAAARRNKLGDIVHRMRGQLIGEGKVVAGPDQDQMQRDNAALMAQLQETRDKLHKLQREGKVEAAELVDRVELAKKENLALQSTVKELTQKGQKIEAAYKEGTNRDYAVLPSGSLLIDQGL